MQAEIRARPDPTLAELRRWLFETRGVSVSTGCLWNTLDRLGLTLKKSRSTRRSRIVPMSPPRGRLRAQPNPG